MEMTQEQLFGKWTELKYNIENLSGIIQNPLSDISHTEIDEWLKQCKKFEGEYLNIKMFTTILLNRFK